MTTESLADAAADARADSVRYSASHRKLIRYTGLSATTTVDYETEGNRETAYRLHTMDMATRRLIPHLLGISLMDCDHLACEMVELNSLTAGYLIEFGHSMEHASDLAKSLLAGADVYLD